MADNKPIKKIIKRTVYLCPKCKNTLYHDYDGYWCHRCLMKGRSMYPKIYRIEEEAVK